MKRTFVVLVALTIILVVSCVPSLYPFYTEKDLFTDEKYQGFWKSENDWLYISKDSDDCKLLIIENENMLISSHYNESLFDITLFQLNDQPFIDLYPSDKSLHGTSLFKEHFVAAHSLAKVSLQDDSLFLLHQNPEFVEKLLIERRIRIKHEQTEDKFLLTAPTSDLQEFVIKYMNEPEAFLEGSGFKKIESVPDSIYQKFGLTAN